MMLLLLLCTVSAASAKVLRDNKYTLTWELIGPDRILFDVVANTTGWVGFGFAPYKAMQDADIVVGGVAEKPYLHDMYANASAQPFADKQQDYELLYASQTDVSTHLRFSRKLNTGDPMDVVIKGGQTRIIWAIGDKDMDRKSFDGHNYDNAGIALVYLLQQPPEDPRLSDDDAKTFDVTMNSAAIVERRSNYVCQIVRADIFGQYKHMITFEPLVQPGHEPFVHHMALYGCTGLWLYRGYRQDTPMSCDEVKIRRQFKDMDFCEFLAIRIGSEPIPHYPADTAYPFASADEAFTFYLLEVHYDNRLHLKNISPDHSGLRFHMTKRAPLHEVGKVIIGPERNTSGIIVPPGLHSFPLISKCGSQCTRHIATGGARIVYMKFHSHDLGRRRRLTQFRNGKKIRTFDDYNYEQNLPPNDDLMILPNDEFVLECEFCSAGMNKTVVGGKDADNEMCYAALSIVPRSAVPFLRCLSGRTNELIADSLSLQIDKFGAVNHPDGKESLERALSLYHWNENGERRFLNKFMNASLYNSCPMSPILSKAFSKNKSGHGL